MMHGFVRKSDRFLWSVLFLSSIVSLWFWLGHHAAKKGTIAATGSGHQSTLDTAEQDVIDDFLEDLLADRFLASPQTRRNLTLCAKIAAEQRWINEFVLHHALLGVQHFYFYDTQASSELEETLRIWIDAGLVTLHHVAFSDPALKKEFHWRMLEGHCRHTYGQYSDWVAQHDVDEFLNLAATPNREPIPRRRSPGDWDFPLTSLLNTPRLADKAALMLARQVFLNEGYHQLAPLQSVVTAQIVRKTYYPRAGIPDVLKSILHIGYSTKIHTQWQGHDVGLQPAQAPVGIRPEAVNALGYKVSNDKYHYDLSPMPMDLLSINHYVARDWNDCAQKIGVMQASGRVNYRTTAGTQLCDDFSLPAGLHNLTGEGAYAREDVVYDTSLATSFVARAVQEVIASGRLETVSTRKGGTSSPSVIQVMIPDKSGWW